MEHTFNFSYLKLGFISLFYILFQLFETVSLGFHSVGQEGLQGFGILLLGACFLATFGLAFGLLGLLVLLVEDLLVPIILFLIKNIAVVGLLLTASHYYLVLLWINSIKFVIVVKINFLT